MQQVTVLQTTQLLKPKNSWMLLSLSTICLNEGRSAGFGVQHTLAILK